ncbi:coiled-coil domain containing protein 47 precursor, putative [Entamoeba invadens IP1]|uniref:coiled-coil domain containing protein 47 precursor, putative n=1 Tax=Entamoeba invadens IP1 TaxID=370355 RepID=UPI0002C3DEAA|nr:coiled-coil domain containing protein 47 precursor, putative [Entamoeba invadens IP1]ELP93934.1 coiled-coil domain containing protein 47 precursor, putative [Entamoeba invadens IP1]|eukprot:XP_004260705.1 coiled-coil domain containing protein 47 precursor, putative [Entamoeba invadens IP1]
MKLLFLVFLLIQVFSENVEETSRDEIQEENNSVNEGGYEEVATDEQEEGEEHDIRKPVKRPRRPQPVKERIEQSRRSYIVEYIVGSVIAGYLTYFFFGKAMNSNVVTTYAQQVHTPVFRHFKQANSNVNSGATVGIMSLTCNEFVIELSEHPFIKGASINFNLIKRQDMFSHLLALISGGLDEMSIDVVFDSQDVPPCIFGVCKNRYEKKMRKQFAEISKFCKVKNGNDFKLGEKFKVVSDAFNTTGILSDEFAEFIKKNEDIFNYFILSDQSSIISEQKALLRFSMKLADLKSIQDATEFVFTLAENVKNIAIDGRVLEKCLKVRADIAEEEAKEKAKKIRAESLNKINEEKVEKFEAMSVEERRKYEDRQRTRSVKKKQVRVTMG